MVSLRRIGVFGLVGGPTLSKDNVLLLKDEADAASVVWPDGSRGRADQIPQGDVMTFWRGEYPPQFLPDAVGFWYRLLRRWGVLCLQQAAVPSCRCCHLLCGGRDEVTQLD